MNELTGELKQSSNKRELEVLTQLLKENDCIKFGEFTLKSGPISKYYIDLREATLCPELFHSLVETIEKVILEATDYGNTSVDDRYAIVGVPYGVVPVAAAVAYKLKLPYFPVRKEEKSYGNKHDSSLLSDHKFILIEDVMSTGSSIIDTIKKLQRTVTDVVVVVDREAGGVENIKSEYPHIMLHSVLKISEILGLKEKETQSS